jgi:hypothetical protein
MAEMYLLSLHLFAPPPPTKQKNKKTGKKKKIEKFIFF